jgi:hypothetical protein
MSEFNIWSNEIGIAELASLKLASCKTSQQTEEHPKQLDIILLYHYSTYKRQVSGTYPQQTVF